ncbi:putative LOC107373498-like protein, partial [Nothobranchius furzeri]
MKCFLCKRDRGTPNSLIKHLKVIHGLCTGRTLYLKCGQMGCSRSFGSFSGFRKHLNKCHVDNSFNSVEEPNVSSCQSVPNTSNSTDFQVSKCLETESGLSSANLVNSCASVIYDLQAAGLGQSIVNSVVGSMEEIVKDVQQHAKETVIRHVFNDERETEVCKKVEACFDDLDNPFSILNSEYKRSKFLSEKREIVEPLEYVIGSRFDTRRNKSTGTYDQIVVKDKFMYIPILSTLQSVFNSQYAAEMLISLDTNDSTLRDISDGSFFKTHPLFSTEKHTVQIQMFYDDFEVANPLGSKRSIHKMGAIYFTLRNFSPKWNSVLANIHLCALFHAQDLKRYGFNEILAPVVRDIKVLESDGIVIPLYGGCVRGSLVQVTGDNLALHSLFGLVESFSARYCCRFCLAEKDDFQTEFSEDSPKIILRTKDTHTAHCQEMAGYPSLPYVFGVKSSCALNSLTYFHTSENFAVDVMHDILEGVAQ